MMSDSRLEEIRRRMSRGESIDDVDLQLIERSGLSSDEKAALWLYAWSFVPRRKQRASAELHLRLVTPRS
jgi:rhamnogalacturonyl hydrolase YesR